MADAARIAASLGLALRDLRRDFPHAASEDLLDFAASVVQDGFEAPPEVREIRVSLGFPDYGAPVPTDTAPSDQSHPRAALWVMPKPSTVQ